MWQAQHQYLKVADRKYFPVRDYLPDPFYCSYECHQWWVAADDYCVPRVSQEWQKASKHDAITKPLFTMYQYRCP